MKRRNITAQFSSMSETIDQNDGKPASFSLEGKGPPSIQPISTHLIHNFASLYCKKNSLQTDRFATAVFWQALYPHARFLWLPLSLLNSDFFADDWDFIRQAGLVESMAEYIEVENCFRRAVNYNSALRGALRLRVSSRRIRRIANELFSTQLSIT